MTENTSPLVSIHTVENRFEADLLMDALLQEGIPALLRTFEETAYDGLFIPQRGWGRILAPEDQADRAKEIIRPLLDQPAPELLYEDPANVDPLLWERLEEADPDTICRNAQVRYDAELGAYEFPFLDGRYRCSPGKRAIYAVESTPFHEPYFEFYLVALHYLLDAQPQGITGQWSSEKDLPGGSLFFQGPHQFPTAPLLKRFGYNREIFEEACRKLDGAPADMGDSAYRLWAFPKVPLLFVLWLGDEEFEPALNILFDESVMRHFTNLDVVWALVNVVCRHLKAAADAALE